MENYLLPPAVPFPPRHPSPPTASVSPPPAPAASEWSDESKRSIWFISHPAVLHDSNLFTCGCQNWKISQQCSFTWALWSLLSSSCLACLRAAFCTLLVSLALSSSSVYVFCNRILNMRFSFHSFNLCPGQLKMDPCLGFYYRDLCNVWLQNAKTKCICQTQHNRLKFL